MTIIVKDEPSPISNLLMSPSDEKREKGEDELSLGNWTHLLTSKRRTAFCMDVSCGYAIQTWLLRFFPFLLFCFSIPSVFKKPQRQRMQRQRINCIWEKKAALTVF